MAKYKNYPKAISAKASKERIMEHKKKVESVKKFNDEIDRDKAAKKKLLDDIRKIKAR